ncbi:hypothetical protein ACLMJK_006398 [Lecanora helva]
MQSSLSLSLFGLFTLLPLTHATASTKAYELCTTLHGNRPVRPVPSKTAELVLTFHPTVHSTSTPVTTVTPPATTISTTVYDTTITTVPVVTDTFSSTSTEIDLSTVEVTPIVTETSTETTTTTAPTPTSTVPTSPGFVPVASATAQFNTKRRRDLFPRHPRSWDFWGNNHKRPQNKCSIDKGGHISYYPSIFPTLVKCGELVEVFSTSTIVATGKSTATQTASTPIVTTTVTDTITSTDVPVDASTTLTFSTTIINTITVTDAPVTSTVRYFQPSSSFHPLLSSISHSHPNFPNLIPPPSLFLNSTNPFLSPSTTQTVTSTPPTATFYAACASNNQVSQVSGYGIDTFDFVGALNIVGDGTTSPYDCCVACITDPNCGASLDAGGLCQVFYPTGDPDTCAGPDAFAGYYLGGMTAMLSPEQGFTVSDGDCGQASADGTD